MTREERLEAEVAKVRREARELREAFHASYGRKERWMDRIDTCFKEMEWWQWFFCGFAIGILWGFAIGLLWSLVFFS